jgi:hypothetical protein
MVGVSRSSASAISRYQPSFAFKPKAICLGQTVIGLTLIDPGPIGQGPHFPTRITYDQGHPLQVDGGLMMGPDAEGIPGHYPHEDHRQEKTEGPGPSQFLLRSFGKGRGNAGQGHHQGVEGRHQAHDDLLGDGPEPVGQCPQDQGRHGDPGAGEGLEMVLEPSDEVPDPIAHGQEEHKGEGRHVLDGLDLLDSHEEPIDATDIEEEYLCPDERDLPTMGGLLVLLDLSGILPENVSPRGPQTEETETHEEVREAHQMKDRFQALG